MALTNRERAAKWRERRRLRLSAPSMVARVADAGVADGELSEIERAVRGFRSEILADLGGPDRLALTKRMQVDSLVERWIVRELLAREVLDLAQGGALVNRRTRRGHPILGDWLRVTDSFDRQLREVGLERLDGQDEQAALLGALDRRLAEREQAPRSRETAPEHTGIGAEPGDPATGGDRVAWRGPGDEAGRHEAAGAAR